MSYPEQLDAHPTTLEGSVTSAEQLFKRFEKHFKRPDDSEMSKNPLPHETTVTDVLSALHSTFCHNAKTADQALMQRAIGIMEKFLGDSRITIDLSIRNFLEEDLQLIRGRTSIAETVEP